MNSASAIIKNLVSSTPQDAFGHHRLDGLEHHQEGDDGHQLGGDGFSLRVTL